MARHHFPRPPAWSLLGFTLILCGLPVWTVADSPATTSYSFTTFDVPGATYTTPMSINDSGQVAGEHSSGSHGLPYGFVYSNGTFTTLDVPGATSSEARSINASGQVAGQYFDGSRGAGSRGYGFVYSNGTFTTLDPPGATYSEARSISASGQVTGRYTPSYGSHGFIATPMVTDIPTLSQWALLLGGGLLVGMAWLNQARQKFQY